MVAHGECEIAQQIASMDRSSGGPPDGRLSGRVHGGLDVRGLGADH
jgi:hypothetical protein